MPLEPCVASVEVARPRMKMTLCPGPLLACVTFGRYLTKSSNVVTFSCFMVSPVSAWI